MTDTLLTVLLTNDRPVMTDIIGRQAKVTAIPRRRNTLLFLFSPHYRAFSRYNSLLYVALNNIFFSSSLFSSALYIFYLTIIHARMSLPILMTRSRRYI
jgi:hypothetical protein